MTLQACAADCGPDDRDIAVAVNDFAADWRTRGDLAVVGWRDWQGLAMNTKLPAPEHIDVAMTLNNIAVLHEARGEWDGAAAHYERALRFSRPSCHCIIRN
ncbi:MAG: tetratricopeptide repeat protein [Chthoniobacteraceae bacterium]